MSTTTSWINVRTGRFQYHGLNRVKITNDLVDSSSIEVNRRARHAKTDRLDLGGLLSLLARYVCGERRVWHVVRVPTAREQGSDCLTATITSTGK
jgi:transposase